MRVAEIGLRHHCRAAKVISLAREARLKMRNSAPLSVKDVLLRRDYLAGCPYRELTRKYGIPIGSIVFRLRRAGVEPNRNSQYPAART